MSDAVDVENAYESSQQEMETGEVEIVDSGRVSEFHKVTRTRNLHHFFSSSLSCGN